MIAALVFASGCFGTETGNPPFAPSVTGDSEGMMGIVPMPRIERAWIAIDDLAFVPGATCSAGDEGVIVRHEPGALALQGAEPLEAEPVLTEGDYCALRFERAAWAGAEPSELAGATLAIDAVQPNGTPLRIRSAMTGSIVLLASAPFEMSPDAGGVVLFLDEAALFSGLSLGEAEREADGSIVIDAGTNAALLAGVEARLPDALALFRDTDGDGALSTEERRAGPLAD